MKRFLQVPTGFSEDNSVKNQYNSILHYKGRNTAIAMNVKFAARVKRGLQSHELLSLCFVSSNVYTVKNETVENYPLHDNRIMGRCKILTSVKIDCNATCYFTLAM